MAAALDGVNGTVCNALQYQQFLSSQDDLNPSISCLSRGQTIGMTVSNSSLVCPYLETHVSYSG